MIIEHRENWKEGKWKITISPTDEEIRIKLNTKLENELEYLKEAAEKVYKEWVGEQKQDITIRATSFSNGRKGPISFKRNSDRKTVYTVRR